MDLWSWLKAANEVLAAEKVNTLSPKCYPRAGATTEEISIRQKALVELFKAISNANMRLMCLQRTTSGRLGGFGDGLVVSQDRIPSWDDVLKTAQGQELHQARAAGLSGSESEESLRAYRKRMKELYQKFEAPRVIPTMGITSGVKYTRVEMADSTPISQLKQDSSVTHLMFLYRSQLLESESSKI